LRLLDRRIPTDRYCSPEPWRFDSSFYIGALAIREAEVPSGYLALFVKHNVLAICGAGAGACATKWTKSKSSHARSVQYRAHKRAADR
jgi:hypothetical protein